MNFNNILDIIEKVTRTNKQKIFGQTNMGHNYHHVRATVCGGRKKKNPIPQRGLGY
jgi:hypothetical protein